MLMNQDRKAIEETIELFPKIVTDEHVIEYIRKLYDRFITTNEFEINKRDIYINFTEINVAFEFNYLVTLSNVKKVEYITYSLLQHFRA